MPHMRPVLSHMSQFFPHLTVLHPADIYDNIYAQAVKEISERKSFLGICVTFWIEILNGIFNTIEDKWSLSS